MSESVITSAMPEGEFFNLGFWILDFGLVSERSGDADLFLWRKASAENSREGFLPARSGFFFDPKSKIQNLKFMAARWFC
jgi:hypothetical protein